MHLAILASDRAVALHDDSRVVIQTRSTALEERCDDNHVALACQCAVEVGRRTGDRLRKVEVVYILHLTEVERVVQFLQHNKFGATLCEVAHAVGKTLHVCLHVSHVVLLKISYFQVFHNLSTYLFCCKVSHFR